jgi:flagellin
MALNIISNYAANVAHRNLQASDEAATRSLSKLSSGTRVVSARDDAASMAIGARLNAESQSLKTATVNVGQANSMLQIADGGMATIDNVLVRMKSLAVQASSGNLSDVERGFLNDEYGNLSDEIDRIAGTTKFNDKQLLGSGGGTEVKATAIGADVTTASGIQSLTFSSNSPIPPGTDVAGNKIIFSMQENAAGSKILTLSAFANDGTTPLVDGNGNNITQSIDVTQFGTTGSQEIGVGQTKELNFDELGIKLKLNENFVHPVDDTTAAQINDWSNDATANTSGAAARTIELRPTSTSAALADVDFQIGSGNTANDRFTVSLTAVDTGSLGTVSGTDTLQSSNLSNQTFAQAAIETVGNSINDLQTARAKIGVFQNRLDFAAQNLSTTQENTEAARSTLMDLDVASEMTAFSSKQVLVQSGVAMLAQANQMPQNLLRLLQ